MTDQNEKVRAYALEMETAIHEAGHFVAAYRFNHYAGPVTIVPHEGTLGSVISEDAPDAEEHIIVYMAGHAAEQMFNPGCTMRWAAGDNQRIDEICAKLPSNERRSMKLRLRARARKLVRENWRAVMALAKELRDEKTLTGEEAEIIVDAADMGKGPRTALRHYRRNVALLRGRTTNK